MRIFAISDNADFEVGMKLAGADSISLNNEEEINKYIESTTIEGLYTLKSIKKLLRNKKIKMPIIDLIYDIIINDKEPSELKRFLIEKE